MYELLKFLEGFLKLSIVLLIIEICFIVMGSIGFDNFSWFKWKYLLIPIVLSFLVNSVYALIDW